MGFWVAEPDGRNRTENPPNKPIYYILFLRQISRECNQQRRSLDYVLVQVRVRRNRASQRTQNKHCLQAGRQKTRRVRFTRGGLSSPTPPSISCINNDCRRRRLSSSSTATSSKYCVRWRMLQLRLTANRLARPS